MLGALLRLGWVGCCSNCGAIFVEEDYMEYLIIAFAGFHSGPVLTIWVWYVFCMDV